MSEATNFKNNKTGQQIDLVDQDARDQISELNETLTELKNSLDSLDYFALSSSNVISISDGEDLNDYITIGNYRAATNSIATTLVNCPTEVAFSLKIMQAEGAYIQQFIIDRGATIYARFGNADGSNFRAWSKVQTETVS